MIGQYIFTNFWLVFIITVLYNQKRAQPAPGGALVVAVSFVTNKMPTRKKRREPEPEETPRKINTFGANNVKAHQTASQLRKVSINYKIPRRWWQRRTKFWSGCRISFMDNSILLSGQARTVGSYQNSV